ncbi:MAG: transglutaminase-like domain-containing protein, partial [Candidatus Heimdallarchaeaceae archaeon]
MNRPLGLKMFQINYIRNGIIRKLTPNVTLRIGDLITISLSFQEHLYTKEWYEKSSFLIRLVSPLGTIVDTYQADLEYTGYEEFYSFRISDTLFSGIYMLTIQGRGTDIREKLIIKTRRNLINHFILTYGVEVDNPNPVPINDFVIDIVIPPSISHLQQVTKIKYNHMPQKLIQDKEGNQWLRFIFPQIYPKEKITISYRAYITTKLVGYDVTRLLSMEESFESYDFDLYERYTKAEPFLESNNKLIEKVVKSLQPQTSIGKAISILKYVQQNIEYQEVNGDFGAKFAIEHRKGDCTEFASLFVSLCRAAGVPSRLATSIVRTNNFTWEKHSHAEFFAKGIWWPIDPTFQIDTKYLMRNPETIILLRGNVLSKSHIKEARYFYSDL